MFGNAPKGDDDPLVGSAADREVRWEGETFYVPAPTIRQALEALDLIPGALMGVRESWDRLTKHHLPEWMPDEVLLLFARIDEMDKRAEFLESVIFRGFERPKEKPRQDGEIVVSSQRWDDALSRYCQTFGGEPWTVYNTVSFPFFLVMLSRAERHQARATLWHTEAISIPHAGKEAKKMIGRLRRTAGYVKKDDVVETDMEFMEQARAWRAAQKEA